MVGRAKIKNKINLYKPIIKGTIIRVGVLLVIAIFLFQLANLSTRMLFINRLDETRAVALRYSFQALPFESRDIVLNVSGEDVALLNVTFRGETYYLYSANFTSQEIKNVGAFEKDGEIFLVLWPFEVEEEKEYVIDGIFSIFYKYGTKEPMPVLVVEGYHDFGPLDEFILMNNFFLSEVTIGLWILTAACVLVLMGSSLWFIMEMSK